MIPIVILYLYDCGTDNQDFLNDEEILFSGEFDTIEGDAGERIRCRSACSDQENSLFVTTSSYPNKNSFIHQEEFCIITEKLVSECRGFKRKPLDRFYPNLCQLLKPLDNVK